MMGLLSFQTILIFHLSFLWFLVYNVCIYKYRTMADIHHGGDSNNAHPSCKSATKKKPIIVCGDLNVAATPLDLKNPKSNVGNAGFTPEEREKFQELLASGYVDTYRYLYPDKQEFSWWSYRFKARERNAGWRIDYFLMSEFAKDNIVDAQILTDVYGSDHCPVLLQIDV